MAVEFGLLGEVTAHVDGRAVDLGPARQRCVLAALAVDVGRAVPVERLVERVWGPDAPVRARTTLHSYLSRLRQALADSGEVDVVRRSGGYALVVGGSEPAVDLHRFHELRGRARGDDVALLTEALALWRGEALTGLSGQWAEAERERLRHERLAVQHDLVDARLRAGQGGELVAELSARAAEHPLDERVAGQYLLALYRGGRQADALEHYRQVRERLVDELGTEPGAALQDLHRRVLTADPSLAADEAAARRVRSPAVPLQLPASPGSFTGRVPELAELDRILIDAAGADPTATPEGSPAAGSTVLISTIGGAGGLGKTWLALAWAHRVVGRFPDGQLFVDLRGFSPAGEPMTADEAVRGFLDALGVAAESVPVDPDARVARYRSLVAGRRMLIVLDNAATADQVVPLLPGSASCTVLVTSRNRLPGLVVRHGAHPLNLDVLTDAESRQLLVARLGAARVAAEEAAVADLVGLCGGFPLALGVIAARAAAEPHLPLADTVAELREHGLDAFDDTDPAASLPTVLSWSLHRLTEPQRTAFALLGIAPGPDTGLPAAANLTGLPERETRATLRALADASLLDRAPGGRYAMHDLVRAYATTVAHDHLPEPVRRTALERVLDFYLHTAHTAGRLMAPHAKSPTPEPPAPGVRPHPLPDDLAAMAWMSAEHAHLLAAQHTAAAHHHYHTVWHLARNLALFHWRRGHRHDELAVWQAALDAAAHLPDPAARIHAHRRLGRAHAQLGRHEEAIEHLRRALTLAGLHHDTSQHADIHNDLAGAWGQRGDDHKALHHARQSLELHRTLDNPVMEAYARNNVGWCAARVGDYDTAREHCLAALALHRRHHHADGEATALDSLGYIDHHTGHYEQALDHYEQALAIYRTLGHVHYTANSLDRLGHSHTALGRHDRARAEWREAMELYRQQGRDTDAERVRRQLDDLDSGAGDSGTGDSGTGDNGTGDSGTADEPDAVG
ncbi:AfsR/SARP family transcriptional regulator [Saccharothrix australiensis]|uniref:DNA-binding SARP family transcriptional activator n=1 Tax=Saccharothrix australiensis TaxID=2072 RepID=A0A495VY75_9PSEU|nr:BTAD domain-containing putative transcriptional regulator [Saccharothrix australiensis]RKT54199.1 DNA-binding SARP family transcriptional activator [Saccharothrix australiensis]